MTYDNPLEYDKRQANLRYLHGHWHPRIMNEISTYCFGKTVVDLGCGTGRYTRPIYQYTDKIVGYDISDKMLEVARTKYPQLTFVKSDACALPIVGQSVDTVVAVGLTEYVDRPELFREIARIIKTNGIVILVCPNKYSLARLVVKIYSKLNKLPYTWNEPTTKEIRRLAKQYEFKVKKLVMDDGYVWLPAFVPYWLARCTYWLFEAKSNPFSNEFLMVLEKQ